MIDRRRDDATRDRVALIQSRWERTGRSMWLAIIGLYLCLILLGLGAYELYRSVQDSRVEYVRSSCEADNQQNVAIRAVLASAPDARRYIERFPIIANCESYARARAGE